nr:FtsX-like permease family protein [Desulfobacula sp.]
MTGLVEIKEGPQVAAANIYIPLDAARELLKGEADSVNLFYLKLEDPFMLNRVRSEILARVPGASVNSSDSFLELMGGVSLISEKFSLVVSLAGLAGAVLLIMKTMAAHLLERKKEIGTLKALGWTGREVRRQLTAEAFIQAVSGGILGVLLGYLISFGLGFLSVSIPLPWELNPVPAMAGQAETAAAARLPVSVSISLAFQALGLSVVIGCLCAFYLGRKTEKMKPADILRQL